jgi:hypothetical protein
MHLITTAHLGEAQGVIETFKLKKLSQDIYVGESLVVLITGEGPFEASIKTALTIPKYPFTKVINIGIAGTLDSTLNIGEIYPVRTIYLVQDLKPQFKTFHSFKEGIDCITSFERMLDPEKAKFLRGIGKLVDREAWGVAMAAKVAAIEFISYKLVSDIAGTVDACESIREQAEDFSQKIAEFIKGDEEIATEDVIPGFYFTFSTRHQLDNLTQKLSIKYETKEVFNLFPVSELQEMKLAPKERTKRLIQLMEQKLDPLKKLIEEKKSLWMKTFEDQGFKVQTDPSFENSDVTISMTVKHDEDLHEKAQQLKNLTVVPFKEILRGNFHVE